MEPFVLYDTDTVFVVALRPVNVRVREPLRVANAEQSVLLQ